MIAACPTCGARYRIDTAKLRPEGARLRCSRCESVFRVRAQAQPGAAASIPAEPAPAAPAAASEAPPPTAAPTARPAPVQTPRPAPAQTPRPAPAQTPRPAPAQTPRPAPVQTPRPAPVQTPRPAPAPREETSEADRERLVLVAHPETEAGKAIAESLSSWGLRTLLVHDGVEAILNIQRSLPRVVVLDAALPKMFGFQVCELMKRNESLRRIHVVLIGAIHDEGRYRRPPGELYGADAYVEPHQLPDALAPLLGRFGLTLASPRAASAPPEAQLPPIGPAPRRAQPEHPELRPRRELPTLDPLGSDVAPEAAPAPVAPAPQPAPAAPADPALAAEIEQADRLARIIVSDIVLYNPEKFEAGLRDGDVVEALSAELSEGHALFAQRVDPRIGDPETYLRKELLRVAQTRGAK